MADLALRKSFKSEEIVLDAILIRLEEDITQTECLSWTFLLRTKRLSLRSEIDFLPTQHDGDSIVYFFQKCGKKSRAY